MHVLHIIALELRTIMTGWGEKSKRWAWRLTHITLGLWELQQRIL